MKKRKTSSELTLRDLRAALPLWRLAMEKLDERAEWHHRITLKRLDDIVKAHGRSDEKLAEHRRWMVSLAAFLGRIQVRIENCESMLRPLRDDLLMRRIEATKKPKRWWQL